MAAGRAARAAQAAGRGDDRGAEREASGRVVGRLEHVAAARQGDLHRELAEDRVALGVQRLDTEHGLAGQDQMDAARAALPSRQRLEQADRLGGGAVGAGQQHLELVDHTDDPGQRLALAQVGEPRVTPAFL